MSNEGLASKNLVDDLTHTMHGQRFAECGNQRVFSTRFAVRARPPDAKLVAIMFEENMPEDTRNELIVIPASTKFATKEVELTNSIGPNFAAP